jgi:hypothetical protein
MKRDSVQHWWQTLNRYTFFKFAASLLCWLAVPSFDPMSTNLFVSAYSCPGGSRAVTYDDVTPFKDIICNRVSMMAHDPDQSRDYFEVDVTGGHISKAGAGASCVYTNEQEMDTNVLCYVNDGNEIPNGSKCGPVLFV